MSRFPQFRKILLPIATMLLLIGLANSVNTITANANRSANNSVHYVWSGAVTANSAVIKAKVLTSNSTVRIAYGTNSSLNNASFTSAQQATAAANNTVAFTLNSLLPNTTYHYGVEVDGTIDSQKVGKFITGSNIPQSFRFIAGADSDNHQNHEVFDGIRAYNPRFFIHTGDIHYNDINVDDPVPYLNSYNQVHNLSRFSALFRNNWVAYVWDDHDYTGNDRGGNQPGSEAAQTAYMSQVPHFPLEASTSGEPAPIYQAWSVGRVRFIMTDLRSKRSQPGDTMSASRTMLGGNQRAWFKQELLDANGNYPIIIWISSVPWIATPQDGADHWGGYHHERTDIANFIKNNNIQGVHILAGDAHMVALDDGTNSDYALGGGAPMPVFQAAALSKAGSVKGGPYSHGQFAGAAQFGLFDVTDNGGDSICIRFRGVQYIQGVNNEKIDWTNCVAANPTFDYGNLPASFGAGTLAEDGARHVPGNWSLGSALSSDSAPGSIYSPPSDVDGVVMRSRPIPGGTATIRAQVVNTTSRASTQAQLGIWADWNQNGTFDQPNEFTSQTVTAGTTDITLNVPNTYIPSSGIMMRVRLFAPLNVPGNSLDFADYRGAVYDGEVEDYLFLSPTAVSQVSVSAEMPIQPNLTALATILLCLLTSALMWHDRRAHTR